MFVQGGVWACDAAGMRSAENLDVFVFDLIEPKFKSSHHLFVED